jgi:hypothetical protein
MSWRAVAGNNVAVTRAVTFFRQWRVPRRAVAVFPPPPFPLAGPFFLVLCLLLREEDGIRGLAACELSWQALKERDGATPGDKAARVFRARVPSGLVVVRAAKPLIG